MLCHYPEDLNKDAVKVGYNLAYLFEIHFDFFLRFGFLYLSK